MVRKLAVILLMVSVGVVLASSSFAAEKDVWKAPQKMITKRASNGTMLQGVEYPTTQQATINYVSDGNANLRCLLGGGRKLIRHDCGGEDPPSLETIFTKDQVAGFGEMRLHDGLSSDNGATWLIAGPLSSDEADTGRDRNHIVDFNDDLTYLYYTEMTGHPVTNFALSYWTQDLFKCMQAFNPFVVISNAPPPDSIDEYYGSLAMTTNQTAYLSFIDFTNGNPYGIYFRKSTDNGTTWGDYYDIAGTIGTDGFDAQGFDGPIALDADGDFVAGITFVNLDPTWAAANGFYTVASPTYPAYTQSTDGGETWADLRLIHGNDGSLYPRGHSGNAAFDDSVHYIGGTHDAAYTAFNSVTDPTVVTSDGLVHATYTMRDTTFGYVGIWHALIDNGTITTSYVGFPENPGLEGASGVADLAGISKAADGHVVIGWTEYMQGSGGGSGDVCFNVVAPGQTDPVYDVPMNVTDDAADITFQRIVDMTVPVPGTDDYYIDWTFAYYGSGGNFADSTLWHLQTTYVGPTGIEDNDINGPGVPKVVSLGQNYPNPFNPSTSISYTVDQTSRVTLEIMNLRGQLVRTLVNEVKSANSYTAAWDGTNSRGETVTSGIYFYRLRTDNGFNQTKKMVLLK